PVFPTRRSSDVVVDRVSGSLIAPGGPPGLPLLDVQSRHRPHREITRKATPRGTTVGILLGRHTRNRMDRSSRDAASWTPATPSMTWNLSRAMDMSSPVLR